jgi:hypothetical protein
MWFEGDLVSLRPVLAHLLSFESLCYSSKILTILSGNAFGR